MSPNLRKAWVLFGALSMLCLGCQAATDADVMEADAELAVNDDALVQPMGPACGRDTAAHGLVDAQAGATSCLRNADCNISPKPMCAAPSDNTCLCTARNSAEQCTAGICLWHTDPSKLTCTCVPGQIQRCATTGIQECLSDGSAWGPCT